MILGPSSNNRDLVQVCVHTNRITMSNFITHLDQHKSLFYDVSLILIKRFVASAVDNIHKLRIAKLGELEAPWLNNVYNSHSSLFKFYL